MKLIVSMIMLAAGCGGGTVVVEEGARVTSCLAVQEAIVAEYEAGRITREEATQRVDCVRQTCTLLHQHITEGYDGGE